MSHTSILKAEQNLKVSTQMPPQGAVAVSESKIH